MEKRKSKKQQEDRASDTSLKQNKPAFGKEKTAPPKGKRGLSNYTTLEKISPLPSYIQKEITKQMKETGCRGSEAFRVVLSKKRTGQQWIMEMAKGRMISVLEKPFKSGLRHATERIFKETPDSFAYNEVPTEKQLNLIKKVIGSYNMNRIEAFLGREYNKHDVIDLTWPEICSCLEDYYLRVLKDTEGKVSEVKSTGKSKNNIRSLTDETLKHDNVFLSDGERWLIKFQGKNCSLNNCKGLEFIHILIKNQGKKYIVQDLLSEYSGRPIKFDGADDLYDEQALAEYEKKIKELDNDIEKAKRNEDWSKIELLEKERSEIVNQLEQTWQGHTKKLNPAFDKIRNSIGKAITRAFTKIQNQLPELAEHLKESIPTPYSGVSLSYHPSNEMKWFS